jgi:hypothetical protein
VTGPSGCKKWFVLSGTYGTSAVTSLQIFGAKGIILQERNLVGHPNVWPYHNTQRTHLGWQRMINAYKLQGMTPSVLVIMQKDNRGQSLKK